MISAQDRQEILQLIDEALQSGGSLETACVVLGISQSTYFRWKKLLKEGWSLEDRRPTAELPDPKSKMTQAEKDKILEVLRSPEFADTSPLQIVPILAERGIYLCSASTMYRILRENPECRQKSARKKPQKWEASAHKATGPNQVWSWDITYLNAGSEGEPYVLYLILDIFSRYIVGWEIWEEQTAENSSVLLEKAAVSQNIQLQNIRILHSDNGSSKKGATLLATLERLGISPQSTLPSESLFSTPTCRPNFEIEGFFSLQEAREWCATFVEWYNTVHRLGGRQLLTPQQCHYGEWEKVALSRTSTLEAAKAAHPERWKGRKTRAWEPTSGSV